MNNDLKSRLNFIIETDKMKNIERATLIADGSRRETDAEHSWHISLMAMTLFDFAANKDKIDLRRVLEMLTVHDLIEIYAGDTFAYDVKGNEDKAKRETESADKLFAILPGTLGQHYRKLWEEFDGMETCDAKFAASCDRLQPFINNSLTNGHTWLTGRVSKQQVLKRMAVVEIAMPALWRYVLEVINNAIDDGYIKEN